MEAKETCQEITVLYLLYNAEQTVEELVRIAASQEGAGPQSARFLFVDDRSPDQTWNTLLQALKGVGNPPHLIPVRNEKNLGLSLTLNTHLRAITTPFALTCHCDVYFGSATYVRDMLSLLKKHPEAGAITGQPMIPRRSKLPLGERVNLVANLMDIFPLELSTEVIPIGFAEGRCDGFRMAALKEVDFYTHHPVIRTAGEDVVLAGKLRRAGYQVFQAPRLLYELSASEEQNSIRKLIKHVYSLARVVPFLVLKTDRVTDRLMGEETTPNRRQRTFLRVLHLAGTLAYFTLILGLLVPPLALIALLGIGLMSSMKWIIFRRHLRAVPFTVSEKVLFALLQPVLDVTYTMGVLRGITLLRHRIAL